MLPDSVSNVTMLFVAIAQRPGCSKPVSKHLPDHVGAQTLGTAEHRHNDALARSCVAHLCRLSNNDVVFLTSRACLDIRTEPATAIERIRRFSRIGEVG